jgi:cell division protein FtsB
MRRLALAVAVVLVAALWAVADPHAGIRSWRDLRAQLGQAQSRATALREEVAALEAEADRLEHDPLAVESAIRSDLGLARPGETIVRVVPPSNP